MSDGAVGDGTTGDDAAHDGTGGIAGSSGMRGGTGGPRRGLIVTLVCGVVPAALLAAIIAVPAALWSRLPDRVADHWTFAGMANSTTPRLVSFLVLGVLALVGAGLVWLGWAATRKSTRAGAPGYSASTPGYSAGAPEIPGAAVRGRAAVGTAGTGAACCCSARPWSRCDADPRCGSAAITSRREDVSGHDGRCGDRRRPAQRPDRGS